MKTALYSKYITYGKYFLCDKDYAFIKYELDKYSGKNKNVIIEKYVTSESDTLPEGYRVINLDDYDEFVFYQ